MAEVDYRTKFLELYQSLKQTSELFFRMKETVEDSPWHREANVLVHTDMVVGQYIDRVGDAEWLREDFLGAVACMFHDTGKPAARTEKFKPERGTYYAYPGHELISARVFENFAANNPHLFSTEEMFIVSWMIEYHMPWDIKDRTKRENMAMTVKSTGMSEVFLRVLASDQYGRISDDAEAKAIRAEQWFAEFRELVAEVELARLTVDPEAPVLYMPIACSGSGKSTFRRQLVGDMNVFSLDDLRHEFYDATDYAKAFQLSTEDKSFDSRANARFHAVVKQKKDLFVDNTNCSAKRRRWYLDIARKHGYTLVAVLFPIPLQDVIDRQQTRGDKVVPAHAVSRQYMSLQMPSYGEFDRIASYSGNL